MYWYFWIKSYKTDLIRAKAAKDYLNDLLFFSNVIVRRITEDRYGRNIAEWFKGPINIQEQLVEKKGMQAYTKGIQINLSGQIIK